MRGTISISLSEGWKPTVYELDEPSVVGLTVLGEGKFLGSPEDVVVLLDCPVVFFLVVQAELCQTLKTSEAFVGSVGEGIQARGEGWVS